MRLNVNSSAVVRNTARLEKMHRSALPVAIRGALNNAAFDVKQSTMPRSAKKAFVHRQPNFFKANSKVEMAKGFDVKTMKSTVGFIESKLKGARNFAVKDLEEQEHGGSIKGRSMIPLDPSRVGSSSTRPVKVKYRLSTLKNVINANNVKANSKKQRFIKAAFMAKKLHGDEAFVLGNKRRGQRMTLSKIDSISSNKNKLSLKRTAVYSYEKGFVAKVKPKKFMQRASQESGLKIEHYYIEQARRQIERLNK